MRNGLIFAAHKASPHFARWRQIAERVLVPGAQVNTPGELLSTHTDQIGLNQPTSFPLEGGRRMKITLLARGEQNARARIEVFKGDEKKLDTTVTVPRGQAFIFGGWAYQEGKLIFPLSVTY